MLVKIDFNVSAWIKELKIEAASRSEALEKLGTMTLAEIVEAASEIDSSVDISDARAEILEQDITVQITEIAYDFSSKDMDPAVIDYLKVRLPKEQTFVLKGISATDDIEDWIKDEILLMTDFPVESFKYQIISKK